MKKVVFLFLVIFLCSAYTYSQRFSPEKAYWEWYLNGGWQEEKASQEKEAQRRALLAEYEAQKRLYDASQLLIALSKDIQNLYDMLYQKSQLKANNFVDARLEVQINKLSKEIKEKTEKMHKLLRGG